MIGSNDTEKKVETVFQDFENNGEVPPKTAETIKSLFSDDTEESLNALGTLCETVSASENFDEETIDCSKIEPSGGEPSNATTTIANFWGEACKIVCPIIAEKVLDPSAVDIKGMVEWCIKNPGKCT